MARILIADDEPHFRAGAAAVLSQSGHVVITADDAEQGRRILRSQEVDLVLADIHMHGNDNLSWIRDLGTGHRPLRVILVTGHPSVATAAQACGLTVGAYLVKPVAPEALLSAVQRCLEAVSLGHSLRAITDGYAEEWGLTPRERDTLFELAKGAANKDIASKLAISPRTVEIHVSAILQKSGTQSRAELTATLLGARSAARGHAETPEER